MISPGSPYKACKDGFDSTALTRDVTPIQFTNLPTFFGSSFSVRRYQPGFALTFAPLTKTPKRAPYGVLDWLSRAALFPMRGQEPLDVDGIPGVSFPAPTGWANKTFPPRQPRSLVILGEQTFLPSDPDWLDAVAAAIPSLSAMGVDVYLCRTNPGGSRFLTVTPVSNATFVASGGSNVGTDLAYTEGTAIDPADLEGGDVMFAVMGFYSTGYSPAGLGVNDLSEAAYITYINDPAVPWNRATTTVGTVFPNTSYLQIETASYEASLLLPVTDRCRRFAFDVYGNDLSPPLALAVNPTLEDCDAAFRNGIPGNIYHYSLTGFALPAELAVVADQIVTNALAFFS